MRARKDRRDSALYLAARFFLLWPRALVGPAFRHLFGAACLVSGRLRAYRALALRNIAIAFPDAAPAEKRRILAGAAARTALDFHQSTGVIYRSARVAGAVEVTGTGHLERALAGGRGVILLSAHLGNFPLMITALARRGYPLRTIIRDFRNARLEGYFARVRAKAGVSRIPRHPSGTALRESMRWLKSGGALVIIADQRSDQGVPAPFFGRLTPSPAGPAHLNRKLGSPVLPVSIRQAGKGWKVEIEPPLELARTDDQERDIVENTAAFNRVFEKWIRRSPAEWSSWINDRFPGEEPGAGARRPGA